MTDTFTFKFEDEMPEDKKRNEEIARQRAVEEFIKNGGRVVELPASEIKRPNTAS